MRELEVLDSGHLKQEWEERKAFFEEKLGEQVRSEVKRLLEQALEAERTGQLAVGRYVRDVEVRRDYRNGYYQRDLGTRLGLLRGLRVPRARRGYRSELLPRYQRRQEAVHGLVREAFLRGISTRQVGPVLGDGNPHANRQVTVAIHTASLISHACRALANHKFDTGPRPMTHGFLTRRPDRLAAESSHEMKELQDLAKSSVRTGR